MHIRTITMTFSLAGVILGVAEIDSIGLESGKMAFASTLLFESFTVWCLLRGCFGLIFESGLHGIEAMAITVLAATGIVICPWLPVVLISDYNLAQHGDRLWPLKHPFSERLEWSSPLACANEGIMIGLIAGVVFFVGYQIWKYFRDWNRSGIANM